MHRTFCVLRGAVTTLATATQRLHYTKMVDRVVEVYKDLAQVGEVKGAQILSVNPETGETKVEITKSHRNLTTNERACMVSQHLVSDKNIISFPPIHLDKNVLLQSVSPSGQLKAQVVQAAKDSSTNTDRDMRKCEEHIVLIDLVTGFVKTFDLASLDKHGKVYEDTEFASLEFSPDETKVAYIAEMKYPKPSSFLSPAPTDAGEDDGRGKEFLYREDWGEQLVGKSLSVVCVLDLQTEKVSTYTLPDGLCPGQLSFSSTSCSSSWALIGVGFVSQPYRLGLIYCQNRESRLFHLRSDGIVELMGSAGWNIICPRLSSDCIQLAYLRSTVGGAHAKCSQLCVMQMVNRQERVVIDVVKQEMDVNTMNNFHGLYSSYGLPRRCWDTSNSKIIFSTPRLYDIASYSVSVETGDVTEIPFRGQRVWDVHGDRILVERTSLCVPGCVILLHGIHPHAPRTYVTTENELPGLPLDYVSQWTLTNPDPHPNAQYSNLPISALYFGPTSLKKDEKKRPLLVWAHGGPHTCVVDEFRAPYAFFVRLGFSILFPNYRGSTGAGQDSIDSLPGFAGRTDVSDVVCATNNCLERFPSVLDLSRVFVFGGSHGGFLALHLAAQRQIHYRAVSARNPVVDIATMTGVSDIPDWCFVETGLEFKFGAVPDAGMLGTMLDLSPISRLDINGISIPILLLVGKKDLRVPPSQALNLYRLLRQRGVKTELYLYPDCHPLGTVKVEVDTLVNTVLWFQQHGADLPALTEDSVAGED